MTHSQLCTADTLAALAQALYPSGRARWKSTRVSKTYMTPLLPTRPVVQGNEVEHQRLTARFRELTSFLQAIPPQDVRRAACATPGAGARHHARCGARRSPGKRRRPRFAPRPTAAQRGPAMRAGLAFGMRGREPGSGDDSPWIDCVDDRRATGAGHASCPLEALPRLVSAPCPAEVKPSGPCMTTLWREKTMRRNVSSSLPRSSPGPVH